MEALIAWLNDNGGVGGRPVEGFPYRVTVADALNPERLQTVCVGAVEDDGIEAMIDHAMLSVFESVVACFAEHHVTLVGPNAHIDNERFAVFRPYLTSTWASLDRSLVALARGLSAAGYFEGQTVGVVVTEEPSPLRAYENVLVGALRDVGVEVADYGTMHASDNGIMQSQAASLVLRFRTEGITRVLPIVGAFNYLAFSSQAESQSYHPIYGLGDYRQIAGAAAFYGAASQNTNAHAVSSANYIQSSEYIDRYSASAATDPIDPNDPAITPGFRRCFDTLSEYTGQDYYADGTVRSVAYAYYCDQFFLWADAVRAVGAGYRNEDLPTGLQRLGASYQPFIVNSTDYSSGRLDGASSYAVGIFTTRNSCNCFEMTRDWAPMP